jgi:hypothetical protein
MSCTVEMYSDSKENRAYRIREIRHSLAYILTNVETKRAQDRKSSLLRVLKSSTIMGESISEVLKSYPEDSMSIIIKTVLGIESPAVFGNHKLIMQIVEGNSEQMWIPTRWSNSEKVFQIMGKLVATPHSDHGIIEV